MCSSFQIPRSCGEIRPRASTAAASVVFTEAAAVEARGRISPQDLGIWKDEHIEPLSRVTRFISQHGAVPGIQLAHAGRKASTKPPWEGGHFLPPSSGGWQTIGPSAVSFRPTDSPPLELSPAEISGVVDA